MPALTTIQLYETHSKYLDTSDNTPEAFRQALNEVMPRIYKMGYWREMLLEHSQDASSGYVSLPQDTDSIVSAVIDNSPRLTRSLWHDYKLFGMNDQDKNLLDAFVDDGYAPTYRDLEADSQYSLFVASLKEPFSATPADGTITFRYRQHSDDTAASTALVGGETVLESDSFTELKYALQGRSPEDVDGSGSIIGGSQTTDISKVLSISWRDATPDHPFRIIARYKGVAKASVTTDATKDLLLSDINTSSGVSRYRRFRVGNTNSDSTAHMLLKRRWVDCDSNADLVHVPSNAIVKHGLLGKLAEDNADIQRASYHWGLVAQLLENDTDSYRGSTKPALQIAPNGVGSGMAGMY